MRLPPCFSFPCLIFFFFLAAHPHPHPQTPPLVLPERQRQRALPRVLPVHGQGRQPDADGPGVVGYLAADARRRAPVWFASLPLFFSIALCKYYFAGTADAVSSARQDVARSILFLFHVALQPLIHELESGAWAGRARVSEACYSL